MPDSGEKGKFKAEIGQDVIAEALSSVAKRTGEPVADAAASPEQNKEIESLKAQLELSMAKGREMMERIKDSHEKMLRALADLENFKKRAQKERDEAQRFGIEKLLKDFLPVADNLDRALEHSKSATDFDAMKKGVQMTRKLLDDALAKNGVRSFSSLGKPFDPRQHEAMQHLETNELPPNHVAAEIVRGYMLNDRLVRPALVMISKIPATTVSVENTAGAVESPAPSNTTSPASTAPGAPIGGDGKTSGG